MPDNTKILAFVESEEQVKAIPDQKRKLKESMVYLISFDRELLKKIELPNNFEFLPSERCISPNDYKQFIEIARTMAVNWHKSLSKNWTYLGIDIGWIIEDPFSKIITEIIHKIETIIRTIDMENPRKIVVVNDNSQISKIIISIAKEKGIRTVNIKSTLSSISKEYKTRYKELRRYAKYRILKKSHKGVEPNEFSHSAKGIMIQVYEPGHVSQLAPVIREIKKREGIHPFVICYYPGITENALKKEKIQYVLLDDLITENIADQVAIAMKKFSKDLDGLSRDKNAKEAFVYQGYALWDLIFDIFHEYCTSLLIKATKITGVTWDLIDNGIIQGIILLDDIAWTDRTIVGSAKIKNVTTLIIQHGVTAGTWGYVPLYGDKMAVFGQYSKDFMVKHGTSEEKVVITGRPLFDRLIARTDFLSKGQICKTLNLNPNKRIVVLATQGVVEHGIGSKEEWRRYVSSIVNSFKNLPNDQLIIKLHPAEEKEKYHNLFAELKTELPVVKEFDLQSLLKSGDLLLTESSTVALDAMILGTPVVTINLTGRPDVMPYASSGAAVGVYKEEDITKAIEKVLGDSEARNELKKKMERFVFDYAYKMDGMASKRVVDLIETMLH